MFIDKNRRDILDAAQNLFLELNQSAFYIHNFSRF